MDLVNALEEHNRAKRSQISFDEYTEVSCLGIHIALTHSLCKVKLLEQDKLQGYMLASNLCYSLLLL